MTGSQPRCTRLRWTFAPVAALLLAVSLVAPATAAEWQEQKTQYTRILHPPELANTAEQIAVLIDPITQQMIALHNYTPQRALTLRVFDSADAYSQTSALAATPIGQVLELSSNASELALSEPRLRNLTPDQTRNELRRGVTQALLHEQTQGKLPIGFLYGAALYSEQPSPETEVNARLLDRARRERSMMSWADLNTPAVFLRQPDIAAAESHAIVAFLLDRYGLAAWQRFVTAVPRMPDYTAALATAYGKPVTALEEEWLAYLPEYFGGSYTINYFTRYNLSTIHIELQEGRYYEARDEIEALARFITGAGRTQLEDELRGLVEQVNRGLEADNLLTQGQQHMAAFDYAAAYESFTQARQRYEEIGSPPKLTDADKALETAAAGVTALEQLAEAQRLLADRDYSRAREAAAAAGEAFATLGDADHYRESWAILSSLNTLQTRIAYVVALLGLLNVLWAFLRLRGFARRSAVPGVLQ